MKFTANELDSQEASSAHTQVKTAHFLSCAEFETSPNLKSELCYYGHKYTCYYGLYWCMHSQRMENIVARKLNNQVEVDI